MRTPIVTVFHETLNHCFNAALEGMGSTVRDVIYDFLEKKGVAKGEISSRFDAVVTILTETFGGSARIIIYKTLLELHKEYSQKTDFTYQDSLRDQMNVLKDRVVADHLYPKHSQRDIPFVAGPNSHPMVHSSKPAVVQT